MKETFTRAEVEKLLRIACSAGAIAGERTEQKIEDNLRMAKETNWFYAMGVAIAELMMNQIDKGEI